MFGNNGLNRADAPLSNKLIKQTVKLINCLDAPINHESQTK